MKPKLMAILNITPDSYYSTSRFESLDAAVAFGVQAEKEGADILDIGGESSRPGASPVSEKEELERVIPVIKALKEHVTIPLSIDTVKPAVAEKALAAGVTFINDISGFKDSKMRAIAKESGVDICVMHMQGTPMTMQENPHYQAGVTAEILEWFEKRVNLLLSEGIEEKSIILDPGIGFGKTVADNLEILHNLQQFRATGFRVLLGLSRKTFIRKMLNKTADQVLAATLAMNTLGIYHGANIIRVHDVAEHKDIIDCLYEYKTCTNC